MSSFYTCAAALFIWRSARQFLPASLQESSAVVFLNSASTVGAYIFVLLTVVYLYNTVQCKIALRKLQSPKNDEPLKPPAIPYTVPWVGNAPSFLSKKPHHFWKSLFNWYPRTAGVCSILLGGRVTTVLFDPVASQQILQDRKLDKEEFNMDVMHGGLGIPKEDCQEMYGYGQASKDGEITAMQEQEKMNLEYLLKAERVNELTAQFMKTFADKAANAFADPKVEYEIDLYKWFRTMMFDASVVSLMGSKLPEMSPGLEELFFQFDEYMLSMFFGLPDWMIPKAISIRRQTVALFIKWQRSIRAERGTKVEDPNDIAWEPFYGSRINRARQLFYEKRGFSIKTRGALDLGMVFGIASNAIPASQWMLVHILDSNRPNRKIEGERSLFDHVMDEIKASRNSDGTFNINTLINQPILLSTLNEVLRVYVDTFVARSIPQDVILAYGGHTNAMNNKDSVKENRSIVLNRGSYLILPSYPAHNHPEIWQNVYPHHPPPDQFYPYRFLTSSPHDASVKPVFTTSHTTGTYFPFGGGKSLCPGRNFAKQEILGALAMTLTMFDFDFVSYVDADGKGTAEFPTLRDTFPGSTVMVPSGDMRLRVKRRDALL